MTQKTLMIFTPFLGFAAKPDCRYLRNVITFEAIFDLSNPVEAAHIYYIKRGRALSSHFETPQNSFLCQEIYNSNMEKTLNNVSNVGRMEEAGASGVPTSEPHEENRAVLLRVPLNCDLFPNCQHLQNSIIRLSVPVWKPTWAKLKRRSTLSFPIIFSPFNQREFRGQWNFFRIFQITMKISPDCQIQKTSYEPRTKF